MNDSDGEWHLDKKVPITLIGAILIQTFAFGWYASNLSARIGTLEQATPAAIAEFSKLESAREDTKNAVIHIQDEVESILALVRRNDDRNTKQDRPDGDR